MSIRIMTTDDLPQVLAIQQELSFQDWNERQFISEIKADYAHCIVYTQDTEANDLVYSKSSSKIIGYAIFHLMGEDSELLSIAVSPNSQQKGIGTSLINSGLCKLNFENGDKCFLEVREGNLKARKFYEKNGFILFGTRKKYYSDGENACLYSTDKSLEQKK